MKGFAGFILGLMFGLFAGFGTLFIEDKDKKRQYGIGVFIGVVINLVLYYVIMSSYMGGGVICF